MQLKRILVSLLVAVMMISMAVFAASAADTGVGTLDIAVESSDAEGYLPVTPGGTLDVNIVVTNNPGVSVTSFEIVYDATALDYVSYVFGDLYNEQTVKSDDVNGKITVYTDMWAEKDITGTGVVITLNFKVADTFAGDKAHIIVESGVAANIAGEEIFVSGTTGVVNCKHTNVTVIPASESSCTVAGATECTKCNTCGEVLDGGVELPLADHTPGAAATCTVAQVCTVCNAEVAPKADHTPVAIGTASEATCVSAGITAGEKCSVCEIVITAQEIIPATGVHTPGAAATCTAAQVCTVCNAEVAPKADHTEVDLPAVDATCTATGLTAGKKCSVCGIVTVEQTATDKADHTVETIPAVEATCTVAGSTEGKKCSVCGTVTVEATVVAAKGHTLVEIPAVDATKDSTGLTAGQKCSVCDEIVVPQVEVPALPAASLTWLWVLIICVVVAGGGFAAFYFLVYKKK